jgi:FkbM family methyltransferase
MKKTILTWESFIQILDEANNHRIIRIEEIKSFINNPKLCLFGYGGKGRQIANYLKNNVNSNLIILDHNPEQLRLAQLDGFDVINDVDQIDTKNTTTILAACQSQINQANQIDKNFLFYQEAAYVYEFPFLFNNSKEFTDDLENQTEKLYQVYLNVADSNKEEFMDILKFRISLNPKFIQKTRRPNINMWFDHIDENPTKYKTFLDIGAYDGDTLRMAKDNLNITRGIAVEANNNLISKINSISHEFSEGISIIPYAAWSHECNLQFDQVRNNMISVYEHEDGDLKAVPLDNFIDESVDILKMDIEGSEMMALIGCKGIIKKSLPDVALASYHRPLDIISLYEFFNNEVLFRDNYNFYFNHYSDCFDDTILYCINKNIS